jgi:hypothetical protein
LEQFGVSFSGEHNGSTENLRAEYCPFCDGSKFFLHIRTGQWNCFKCQEKGNIPTFLTRMHAEYLKATTAEDYAALRAKRGIAPQTLRAHGLAYDKAEDRWLIPFKNKQGSVVNIQTFWPSRAKPNKFNLPELPTCLYGFDRFSTDADKLVLLCEGPFDAIALDFQLATNRKKYDVLGMPGSLKEEWAKLFAGRKVRCLFDNDQGGKRHGERAQKLLGNVADELRILRWPDGFPDGCDVNDLVRDHPDVKIVGWSKEHSFAFVAEPKLVIQHGKGPQTDEPTAWIWPDHLPCSTYVSFSGKRGTFKTNIAVELAARYSKGEPMPLCEEIGLPAGHVLYVDAENGPKRLNTLFEQYGGDFEHWHLLLPETVDGEFLNILEHLKEIEQTIRQFGIRFVILDGQNSLVGAPNISTDMLARHNITNKLHRFAQRLNVCLLGVRNDDATGRALGPQSMSDIGRSILRAEELEPLGGHRYCVLKFERVSEVAKCLYPDIPFAVENSPDSSPVVFWGKPRPDTSTMSLGMLMSYMGPVEEVADAG